MFILSTVHSFAKSIKSFIHHLGTSSAMGAFSMDAFDAKFDAFEERSSSATFGNEPFGGGGGGGGGSGGFDAVDTVFGGGVGTAGNNASSGFAAFDAHFGGDSFGDMPAAAETKTTLVKPPAPTTTTTTTEEKSSSTSTTSSSFLGLLSKPPSSSRSNPSPKADSLHHREKKKSDGPSKSKNGLGGKKTDRSKGSSN